MEHYKIILKKMCCYKNQWF